MPLSQPVPDVWSLLHGLAEEMPDAIAFIHGDGRLGFGALRDAALRAAQ